MDCSRAATRDPDRWLERAPAFSQPMAAQLRAWIQRWQPDLRESIKWNLLGFSGRKLVCGLSACQHHLAVTFFRGTELRGETALPFDPRGADNAHLQSLRLTTLDGFDLRAFRRLLDAAVALDERGDLPPPPVTKRAPWPMPEALARALKTHPAAAAGFAALKPTYQREYQVWVGTAKQPETVAKRLEQTLRALAAGKKWAQRRDA